MTKKFLFALLLISVPLLAQSVPPQFSGLMTNATDLTCAGVVPCSTWPMPANPGYGNSYVDPTWGTTTWELNNTTSNDVIPTYSRVQSFSSDNKLMFLTEQTGYQYLDLYDATTTPPTPINRITTTDGTAINSYSGDAYWSNTIPTRLYYIPWDNFSGPGLTLRYVDVSTCTTSSCVLTPTTVHTFSCTSDQYFNQGTVTGTSVTGNVATIFTAGAGGNTLSAGQTVNLSGLTNATNLNSSVQSGMVVLSSGLSSSQYKVNLNVSEPDASFAADTGISGVAGIAGNVIESGSGAQGGLFDLTDDYFSFSCDQQNDWGREEIDFIRYDRATDTVTTQEKWYQAAGQTSPNAFYAFTHPYNIVGVNMFRMNQHPDAAYITVLWQSVVTPWQEGAGTVAYGPTYNLLGPISTSNSHQDNGFDVNGVPVWVGVNPSANGGAPGADYYSIEVTNLTTLSPTAITSREIELPCIYAYTGPNPCTAGGTYLSLKYNHVSCTGTWGSVPGYCLISTLLQAGPNEGYAPDYPPPTTLGTAVTSAGSHTVTPGSMANIGVGTQQAIDIGNANAETVTVTGVTGTTFTATFANTHTSTAPVSVLTVGDTGFGAMENFAVKIDTTQTTGSTAQFYRLGRTMSVRDGDYNAEPHTTVNRDWTAYIWGSNWNTDGGPDNTYYTQLSSTPSYPLTVSITGNGASYGGLSGSGSSNCAIGTNSIASGTVITCVPTAYVGSGWVFTGWGGTCSGMGTCSFSISGTSTVTANFVLTTAQDLSLETQTAATGPGGSSPGWNINDTPADTGGVNTPAAVSQSNGNSSPAGGCTGTSQLDSETTLATSTQTNSLFWYYGAGADAATYFIAEACIYVGNIAAANNIEMDFDQYDVTLGKLISNGHQYHIGSGCWQYANNSSGWQNTSACPAFAGNTWHHIFLTGHRDALYVYYDTITQDGVTYNINESLANEVLPGGYPSALIDQVQINAGPTSGSAATVTYNVDNMNFSAYIPASTVPGVAPQLLFGP